MANTLMPFQENFESWQVIHPRQWIATADRDEVLDFLSTQTKKVVKAQFEAADGIILSQDRIADKIDDLIQTTEDVATGLQEIQATFEWGFTELIWQIEQEREVLKNILKVLQAPLDTQAKELKKRAEYAYRSGWFDDALTDFLESEKINRYDFTIHQNLGNIYLFEKKDPDKALEYYEKAAKYATPKSLYYASISLLHVGLVKYLHDDFQEAYEATSEALNLSPDLHEAHFQHAQYCAKLGPDHYKEAIQHLKIAIDNGGKYYCVKADTEKDFNEMRKELRSLFEQLRNKVQSQAKFEIKETEELIHSAKLYGVELDKSPAVAGQLKEAKVFLKKGSLFDCWDAVHKAKIAVNCSVEYLSCEALSLKDEIAKSQREIGEVDRKIREVETKIDEEEYTLMWVMGFVYLIFTILLTALSRLSAGMKAWLILLFIFTSFAAGPIMAKISTHLKRPHRIVSLVVRKKTLENGLLKITDKLQKLHRARSHFLQILRKRISLGKGVPQQLRLPEPRFARTSSKTKEKLADYLRKREKGKKLEELDGEELLRHLEREEFGSERG